MKPVSRKEDVLLSRNNAKFLLYRNAHDASDLEKEERLLQKKWNLEKSIYHKEREQMLQRRLLLEEKLPPKSTRRGSVDTNMHNNKRITPLGSSFSLPEIKVSRSYSLPPDFDGLRASCDSKPVLNQPASQLAATSDHLLSAYGFRSKRLTSSASGTASNLTTVMSVSLPDINDTSVKICAKKQDEEIRPERKRWRSLTAARSCEDLDRVVDDWKDLRKCRYLRTPST